MSMYPRWMHELADFLNPPLAYLPTSESLNEEWFWRELFGVVPARVWLFGQGMGAAVFVLLSIRDPHSGLAPTVAWNAVRVMVEYSWRHWWSK